MAVINNKRGFTILVQVIILIMFFTVFMLRGEKSAMAVTDESRGRRTVSAQGEGVVRAVPDTAYLTLGVETYNKEMLTAQSDNKEKMNGIIAELGKLGIREQDIQTNNYSIYPNYQWENDKNILTGYRVVNTVRIKVKNLSDAGRILDAAAAKGANLIEGIQFEVEDAGKLYEEALRLAVKNAEDKARTMTGCFGINKLVPVSIIEKHQEYYPVAYENAKIMRAGDDTIPVSSGQLEVRAFVEVRFEYQ